MYNLVQRVTDKIQLWTFENFTSLEECNSLISEARKKGFVESAVQNSKDTSKMNMKTPSRNSTTSFVGKTNTTKLFGEKAKDALRIIFEERGLGEQIHDLKLEGLQVQKYEPDQKYNPHYDTFADKDGPDQRSWTVMVYLNEKDLYNDLEGGSTYFPKIDLRVKPKRGMAVIWNNLDKNYCRDENTLHTGEKVSSGEKIIVTMWFRKPESKDFLCKNPNFLNPASKKSKIELEKKNKEMFSFDMSFDIRKMEWWHILLLLIFIILILYIVYLLLTNLTQFAFNR